MEFILLIENVAINSVWNISIVDCCVLTYHHACIISSVNTVAEIVACRCLRYCRGMLVESLSVVCKTEDSS